MLEIPTALKSYIQLTNQVCTSPHRNNEFQRGYRFCGEGPSCRILPRTCLEMEPAEPRNKSCPSRPSERMVEACAFNRRTSISDASNFTVNKGSFTKVLLAGKRRMRAT